MPLDTRSKIVPLDRARLVAAGTRAVAAYCDPLLPEHVARLRALANGRKLLVVLDTPTGAYLEPRARAELAAALSFVEAVVIGGPEIAAALNADTSLTAEESRARGQFLSLVRDRAGS